MRSERCRRNHSTNVEYRMDQVFGSILMGTEGKKGERKGKAQRRSPSRLGRGDTVKCLATGSSCILENHFG